MKLLNCSGQHKPVRQVHVQHISNGTRENRSIVKGESAMALPLWFCSNLAPAYKVKAVDLLDSKLNEVCEKEVGMV
jgi:hypothetical protein